MSLKAKIIALFMGMAVVLVFFNGLLVFKAAKTLRSLVDDPNILSSIETYQSFFIIIAFISVVSTAGVALIMLRSLLDPLGVLLHAAINVRNGNLSERVHISSVNEFGELADAFNDMLVQLQELNSGLDEKVQQKTKDLDLTIKELNTQKVDLEKLNAFMVDRELKMVELKKEIEQL
jgi:nitrogen fixation/metabolism regulation signal transduction histidine kinase